MALHGSIYFLTADPDGPGLDLAPGELLLLKEMVVARYLEIINRDLEPDNRAMSLYRGLARCIWNWRRLERFCQMEGFAIDCIRDDIGGALIAFLHHESLDIATNQRCSSINCTATELTELINALRINSSELPEGWADICRAESRA